RAGTEHERTRDCDRFTRALGDTDVEQLARLVDAELRLALLATADRLHFFERVSRKPAFLDSEPTERPACGERIAMCIDRWRPLRGLARLRAVGIVERCSSLRSDP